MTHPHPLPPSTRLIHKVSDAKCRSDTWKWVTSRNAAQVAPETHCHTTSNEITGPPCGRHANYSPNKYGIDQGIGDTIGPGGLFKSLRTIPVFLDVLRDAEELCPQAIVLNYTNPMSMLCLAASRVSSLPLVGLCHSVQGTSALLAKRAGVAVEEMEWDCAGIPIRRCRPIDRGSSRGSASH